ncbi:MAG TPA: hypothetical protein ENF75_00425 [Acidilobales archaeon]|nr:hypothetical protein [Acidilobales archaeon]
MGEFIRKHISRAAPGHVTLLKNMAELRYGTDFIELFLNEPSKVLDLLINIYGGDEETATFIFKVLFIKPLATWLGNSSLMEDFMRIIVIKRDNMKFKVLLQALCKE